MFGNVLRRLTLGALLVVSVAALTAATGGSAGVGFVSHQDYPSFDPGNVQCPGFSQAERHYCLIVRTYSNLKKGGAVEVDLTVQNFDSGTLTKPSATLTTLNNNLAKLTFESADPANCLPSGDSVTCSFPNIPGLGSASAEGATPNTSTVKLYFSSAADSATTIHFMGTAVAKENGNDNSGAANAETQTVPDAVMTLDDNTGAGVNEDATVVLPKSGFNKPHLFATLANASVDCQSFCLGAGSPPFIAQFAANNGATCLLGVSCTGLDLNTDFSGAPPGTFSSTNQILWTADVPGTNTNIVAVHTYDSVSLASPATNTLRAAGTRFANCDGVTFDASGTPGGLAPAPQTYFVINKSTDGTTSTFQVASSAKGKPLSFTGSGPFSGSCIRIIGDNPAETTNKCSASNPPKPTDAPAAPKTPPVLCVAKVMPATTPATVRAYLWDDANGHVGY